MTDLLAALHEIARKTEPGTELRNIARAAIEEHEKKNGQKHCARTVKLGGIIGRRLAGR
jgi:hypothetical protein